LLLLDILGTYKLERKYLQRYAANAATLKEKRVEKKKEAICNNDANVSFIIMLLLHNVVTIFVRCSRKAHQQPTPPFQTI
jgi:hypothetical protein